MWTSLVRCVTRTALERLNNDGVIRLDVEFDCIIIAPVMSRGNLMIIEIRIAAFIMVVNQRIMSLVGCMIQAAGP